MDPGNTDYYVIKAIVAIKFEFPEYNYALKQYPIPLNTRNRTVRPTIFGKRLIARHLKNMLIIINETTKSNKFCCQIDLDLRSSNICQIPRKKRILNTMKPTTYGHIILRPLSWADVEAIFYANVSVMRTRIKHLVLAC